MGSGAEYPEASEFIKILVEKSMETGKFDNFNGNIAIFQFFSNFIEFSRKFEQKFRKILKYTFVGGSVLSC